MLKWAYNPALRPNCELNSFENRQNFEKGIQCSYGFETPGNGRGVDQLPKEEKGLPGRRRSLGSLLAKEPIRNFGQVPPRSQRVPRKLSLGREGRAPLATPDALDRNLKTLSLTRAEGFGRETSFLKESPLKRWSKERAGMLLNKDMLSSISEETLPQVSHLVPWPSPFLDSQSAKEGFTGFAQFFFLLFLSLIEFE